MKKLFHLLSDLPQYLILAIIASMDLELHQIDVKTTFLNGELDEEICMEQLVGFVIQGQEHKVSRTF